MKTYLDKIVSACLLVPFVAGMILYGGSKHAAGSISFDTRYVMNDAAHGGSYLSNDVCHVALQRTSAVVPLDSRVLVFATPLGGEAANAVQLLPERTIQDHINGGCDYALENATNYNVFVTADYVPPTPEITNKVLRASALVAKGWTPVLPESPCPFVIPGASPAMENANE